MPQDGQAISQGMAVAPLSVGSFIRSGWETFKKRPGFFILTALTYIAVIWIVNIIIAMIVAMIDGGSTASASSSVLTLLGNIVSYIVDTILAMGLIALTIKATNDVSSVKLADLWHPQRFWSFIGLNILLMIIFFIGFLLFIIPGIIAMTMFLFAPYFVINESMGPIEALKASARITKHNRWRVLAFTGANLLLMILGFVAFLVGALVTFPVTQLGMAHAYKRLSQAANTSEPRHGLTGGEITLLICGFVIPILVGVLAVVALVSLSAARGKAADAYDTANLKELQLSVELYGNEKGTYPASLQDLSSDAATAALVKSVPLDHYTYTQEQDGNAYTICSNAQPGECVSSETTSAASTSKKAQ